MTSGNVTSGAATGESAQRHWLFAPGGGPSAVVTTEEQHGSFRQGHSGFEG